MGLNKYKRSKFKKFRQGLLYKSVLKHALTQESIEMDSYNGTIAKTGSNQQHTCQWLSLAVETQPATFDRILAASINTTITSVNLNQQAYLERVDNHVDFRNNGLVDAMITLFMCYPRADYSWNDGNKVYGANPQLLIDGFTNTLEEYKATSLVAFSDFNATPYMSPPWCSMFRIKPIKKRIMKPGTQFRFNYKKAINYIIKKAKYGLINTDDFAGKYDHMRRNGPLLLVKVEGTVAYDGSLRAGSASTSSTSSFPSGTDSTYHATIGGYVVDWVMSTKQFIEHLYY